MWLFHYYYYFYFIIHISCKDWCIFHAIFCCYFKIYFKTPILSIFNKINKSHAFIYICVCVLLPVSFSVKNERVQAYCIIYNLDEIHNDQEIRCFKFMTLVEMFNYNIFVSIIFSLFFCWSLLFNICHIILKLLLKLTIRYIVVL